MRINNKKYKKFILTYNKRKFYLELKRKIKRKEKRKKYKKKPKVWIHLAPSNFSLINNTDECIDYFNAALKKINENTFNSVTDTLQFEISKIDNMTIDALMYQLAIMTNLRIKNRNIKILRGTLPNNLNIKRRLIESGFLSYVKIDSIINVDKSTSTTEILTGKSVDGECISKVIDFINRIFMTTKINTKFLYTFLSELMTNTKDHAYDKEEEEEETFVNKWYIYAEVNNENNRISITFLDTGLGIPNTVRRKKTEKVLEMISLDKADSSYIISALKGEFRTKTNQPNRGKGMPLINECALNKSIDNLIIISSNGMIRIDANSKEKYIINKINNKLQGTLYYFEIDKNTIGGINNDL